MAVTYVKIAAIDAVINGVEYTLPDTYVPLKDAVTHFDGPGSYHIQLVTGSGIGGAASYVVTYGIKPCDTSTAMTVCRVVQTPTGDLVFTDARNLNVTVQAVNSTVATTPFTDGSYLQTGVVTNRVLAGGIGGTGGILDQIGAVQGDILYRNATEWVVLAPGTSGFVLTTGGAGANPTWATVSAGTIAIPHGSSFPGSPTSYEPFYRDDLHALFIWNTSAWVNADSLAQLNDVTLTSPANGDVLTYNSGAGKWENSAPSSGGVTSITFNNGLTSSPNPIIATGTAGLATIADGDVLANTSGSTGVPVATTLSTLIDHAIGSTRGSILYRGASGWAILTPGTSTFVLTSAGSQVQTLRGKRLRAVAYPRSMAKPERCRSYRVAVPSP